jgi:hypothetical protein
MKITTSGILGVGEKTSLRAVVGTNSERYLLLVDLLSSGLRGTSKSSLNYAWCDTLFVASVASYIERCP